MSAHDIQEGDKEYFWSHWNHISTTGDVKEALSRLHLMTWSEAKTQPWSEVLDKDWDRLFR